MLPRVLLVEDETDVREVLQRMLEAQGFVVDAFADGAAAAEAFAPDRYHLLVTDHVTPGLSGLELVDRVRREAPHLGVIFVVGAWTAAFQERVEELGGRILRKPFTFEELQRAIALAINA